MSDPKDVISIAAMLARGIDPDTGEQLDTPPAVKQKPSEPAGEAKNPASRTRKPAGAHSHMAAPGAQGFRFSIIDTPDPGPVRDDYDALALILPLDKYLARRRKSSDAQLSGPNRYRASARLALEQQWTLEYWRARAIRFEALYIATGRRR